MNMKAKFSTVLMGTAVVALAAPALHAVTPPAQASVGQQSEATAQVTGKQLQEMQARMKLMQQQMTRIRETKSPRERARLLREHMRTMIAQMRAMRVVGGNMMSGMMGGGMTHGGTAGGDMLRGAPVGGSQRATPTQRRQWMRDRLDMMQMMMEQMMGQMQAIAVTEARFMACWHAHGQLMEKPALRNRNACWRMHGYLMERSS